MNEFLRSYQKKLFSSVTGAHHASAGLQGRPRSGSVPLWLEQTVGRTEETPYVPRHWSATDDPATPAREAGPIHSDSFEEPLVDPGDPDDDAFGLENLTDRLSGPEPEAATPPEEGREGTLDIEENPTASHRGTLKNTTHLRVSVARFLDMCGDLGGARLPP